MKLHTCWLLMATVVLNAHACPDECACSQMDADYIVDCSSRDLDSIPTSIPPNATSLNLSNNLLKSISEYKLTLVKTLFFFV